MKTLFNHNISYSVAVNIFCLVLLITLLSTLCFNIQEAIGSNELERLKQKANYQCKIARQLSDIAKDAKRQHSYNFLTTNEYNQIYSYFNSQRAICIKAKEVYNLLLQQTSNQPPSSSTIQVISATYGGNCGAKRGYGQSHIAGVCNGRKSCAYYVDHKVIGDPVKRCAKDYVVEYKCGNSRPMVKSLIGEAGFGDKYISLSCP